MAGNISDLAELLMLDWINGVGTPARPTTPLRVRLMTVNGTDSVLGTEVVGGSYVSQAVTMLAATAGATSNTALLSFANMPACTVVGVELWDSALLPLRTWYGPLSVPKTVLAGDTFQLPAQALSLSLD